MVRYDEQIINALLDKYEKSLLSQGRNRRTVHIDLEMSKKRFPTYFDESSMEYELIHEKAGQLEDKGLISIIWKAGKKGHLIEKLRLNTDNLDNSYEYVNRVPKERLVAELLCYLKELQADIPETAEATSLFVGYLIQRLEENSSVKEYIDIADMEDTRLFIRALISVETNSESCYLREFSIRCFNDSKLFEGILGRVIKALRRFKSGFEELGEGEILAEYGIYNTPNYVYFKGNVSITLAGEDIDLSSLKQGLGISGEDLDGLSFGDLSGIRRVLTIENLTTFFSCAEKDSLIIYLGGYHNSVRRRLLQMIYRNCPEAEYLHFGDIDAGGFMILDDLVARSGIPFATYKMDLETLKEYEKYSKNLTASDRVRLKKIRDAGRYEDVITYMLDKGIKLEQECV